MKTIQIKDKTFSLFIKEEEIQSEIARVADEINRDLADEKPLFVSVLNGAFMFTADLMRRISISCEVSFIKLASYEGDSSTGVVKKAFGLSEKIEGRTIVIVEDIIDTGITMKHIIEDLQAQNPAKILIASLLLKPEKLKVELDVKYVALSIPNDFIVGYGLDYDGYGRNYADIYKIVE